MRTPSVYATVLLTSVIAFHAAGAGAATPSTPPRAIRAPGATVQLLALPFSSPMFVPPARTAKAVPGATITVQFLGAGVTNSHGYVGQTWPAQATNAILYAASLWAAQLTSSVPITMDACWADMGSPVILGQSGPNNYFANFTGAPRTSTWYPVSLANRLALSDLDPETDDFTITLNSGFSWYLGTDGATPSDQYDLVTVMLHEVGHGLGFLGFMMVSGGRGYWADTQYGFPVIYDRFVVNGSGYGITHFASGTTELATQLTGGNLFFAGTLATAANGGQSVKIFAPSTWMQGSSYAHLDYDTFKNSANALMVYAIGSGAAVHQPGPVTLGLLDDVGWNGSGSTPPPPTPTPTPLYPPTGVSATQGQPGRIRISWQTATNALRYSVWRNTANTSLSAKQMVETTQTLWTDTAATAGQTYYYWVKSKGSVTVSDFSSGTSGWCRSRALNPNAATDFDGAGDMDVTVLETGSAYWFSYLATRGYVQIRHFGQAGDVPAGGDYDGDGIANLAVYDPLAGEWTIQGSATGYLTVVQLGGTGWTAVPSDYTGDGQTMPAVYAEATGQWVIKPLGLSSSPVYFTHGGPGLSPVVGDYDGDAKADIVVYQEASGMWYALPSASGYAPSALSFGGSGWRPARGDFDGDGRSDRAISRRTTGIWMALLSLSNYARMSLPFGGPGYQPVAGDADGDTLADLILYNRSTGQWIGLLSGSSYRQASLTFGGPTYIAVQ